MRLRWGDDGVFRPPIRHHEFVGSPRIPNRPAAPEVNHAAEKARAHRRRGGGGVSPLNQEVAARYSRVSGEDAGGANRDRDVTRAAGRAAAQLLGRPLCRLQALPKHGRMMTHQAAAALCGSGRWMSAGQEAVSGQRSESVWMAPSKRRMLTSLPALIADSFLPSLNR